MSTQSLSLSVVLCWIFAGSTCLAQSPSSLDPGANRAILERLDQLEKQNSELLEEIRELRALVASSSGPIPNASSSDASKSAPENAATNNPSQAITDRQQVSEHRIEELAQTKVEASQKYPIQLTGMVLFNAFANGAYGGAAQDPVVAALSAGPRTSGGTLRQTVLGLTFHGPKTLWGGSVSGSLYMDFFGGSAQSLNHLLRLRVATLQIDWAHTTIAVGQDKPLVSRREPNSLAQVGVSPLTAAGNPWLWQPQARVEQRFVLSPKTSIRAEAGIFQTVESANQTADIANRIEAARPAFETRVAFRREFTSDGRVIEIAPVFHTSTSHLGGSSIPSRLFGVDWLIRPIRKIEFTGLAFSGRNFANLGALGGITLVGPNQPTAVHGTGGWAQVRFMPTQRLSIDAYAGQQDDRNSDLMLGRIGKNQYYAANVMYLLAPNVLTSFEFAQVRTLYLGLGTRLNNHYDLALAYLF